LRLDKVMNNYQRFAYFSGGVLMLCVALVLLVTGGVLDNLVLIRWVESVVAFVAPAIETIAGLVFILIVIVLLGAIAGGGKSSDKV